MYLEFYGLGEKPFSQTPDPRFLYWNDAYRETLASLRYGIQERKGFIAMIGEAGTGKTTLLRKLLDDLGSDIMSVFLFNPNATFEEILEYTLGELGITAPAGRKLAMLQRLNEFLLSAFAEGRNVILLIDEAQDLERDVLESLRLLSNLETAEEKILQIVLSGQPELAEKLADPSLRQLKQRIAVRCRLEPLKRSELESYIAARLAVVGGAPDLFLPETLEPIWQFTGGIPRLINTVCDNSLLLGYALGKRSLDGKLVCEVIADLGQLDVAPGAFARPAPQSASTVEPTPTPSIPPVDAALPAAPPPPTPAVSEEPPPIFSAARPLERDAELHAGQAIQRRRVPWILAAALAGALLLLVGAWMGRGENTVFDGLSLPGGERQSVAPAEPVARPIPAPPVEPPAEVPADGATARIGEPLAPPSEPAAAADSRHAAESPPTEEQPPAVEAIPVDGGALEDEPAPAAAPVEVSEPPSPPAPAENAPTEEEAAPPARGASRAQPVAGERAEADSPSAGQAAPPGSETNIRAESDGLAMARTDPEEFLARSRTRQRAPTRRQGEEAPRVARANARPVQAQAPRSGSGLVPVRPGDTLLDLAIAKYGTANLTTLDMLQGKNPEIRSVDLIIAGSGLMFPDPGPESRIVDDEGELAVLAMTTSRLADAVQVQSSLESKLRKPVSLQRVNRGGSDLYRVSVRGLANLEQANQVAEGLGSVLQDPEP